MFEAQYAFKSEYLDAVARLPDQSARSLAQTFLHCTLERTHPQWAARPLTVSNLKAVWPGPVPIGTNSDKDRNRNLRGATESELLHRFSSDSFDTQGLSLPHHLHTVKESRVGGCGICESFFETFAIEDHVNPQLKFSALNLEGSNSHSLIDELARTIVAETIGLGTPIRHLHQTFKWYLFDAGNKQSNSFWMRLREFLNPSPGLSRKKDDCVLTRRIHFKRPSDFSISFPTEPLQGSRLKGRSAYEVLQMQDSVPQASAARESAIEAFRVSTDIWLAYLRLAIGDARDPQLRALAEGDVEIEGQTKPHPAHDFRRLWSRSRASDGIARLIAARECLKDDDRDRLDASVEWLGIAFLICPESAMRSAGLVWMALECLFGDVQAVYEDGVKLLAGQLPVELGWEANRYVTRVSEVSSPTWAKALKRINKGETMHEYLTRILPAIPPHESAFKQRIIEIQELFTSEVKRAESAERYKRDLRFLYAIRNGMAHTGRIEMGHALSLYLLNVGVEVFKAAITDLLSAYSTGEITSHNKAALDQVWRGGNWMQAT